MKRRRTSHLRLVLLVRPLPVHRRRQNLPLRRPRRIRRSRSKASSSKRRLSQQHPRHSNRRPRKTRSRPMRGLAEMSEKQSDVKCQPVDTSLLASCYCISRTLTLHLHMYHTAIDCLDGVIYHDGAETEYTHMVTNNTHTSTPPCNRTRCRRPSDLLQVPVLSITFPTSQSSHRIGPSGSRGPHGLVQQSLRGGCQRPRSFSLPWCP